MYDYFLTKKIIFQSPSSGAYKIHRMLHEVYVDEIPLIGSSRCSGSFMPDLISKNCYNYGIEETEIDLINLMLKRELKKDKSAPIIINFDYEFFKNKRGDLTHFIANINDDEVRSYIGEDYRFLYSIKGIRYFGTFDHYLKGYLSDHTQKNLSSKGGFFLRDKFSSADFEKLKQRRLNSKHSWSFDSEKGNTFVSLIKSCPNREIFIVVAPYHSSYMSSFSNISVANSYLESLDSLKNVIVINDGRLDYPDSLFLNTSHLNLEGAKRFSSTLRLQIQSFDPKILGD